MSSEESNKTSKQTPSQGSPSEIRQDLYTEVTNFYNNMGDEWIDNLYDELISNGNELEDHENFFDIWDKNYAKRQLLRRLQAEEEDVDEVGE